MLQNDWVSARHIAETGLVEHPDNAPLAATYIRSLLHDETIEDPISLIPEPIRRTPEVEEAHVVWLIERAETPAWWNAAIDAHTRHPEIADLKEMYANALLSRAIGGQRYVYGQEIDQKGYGDIETAIQVYESMWDEIRGRTRRQKGDSSSIALNLMIAYRIVGKADAATALGWETVERFPEDVAVKEYLGSALVEEGETGKALQVVSDLEENDHVIAIRYKIAVISKDWKTVLCLADRYADSIPESERPAARAMKLVARADLVAPEEARRILETEHQEFLGDTRASVLLCQSARVLGLEDLSQSLFDIVGSAIQDGHADYPSRLAIAEEAMVRGQPSVAIDALDGRVALEKDSEALRLLGHALVFDLPIRDRAIKFFEDLGADVIGMAHFQKLQGILHFNRGVPKAAIAPLSNALKADLRIDTLMCLIRAHYLNNEKESISKLVESEQVEALDGSALDRINLSHVLLDFSDQTRALQQAYIALTMGLANAVVVMKFLGFVLRATSTGWEPNGDGRVSPGTWVRLTRSGGVSFEGLIDETHDRPWGQAVKTSNSFIARCLGLRKGQEFQVENSLGSSEKWEVSEIKPWWLQAFHHLTGEFGQRFPEARGFATVTIADDDIEPALEQVRRISAMAREQADVYLRNNIPLVMAAGHRPGGVVAFAQYVSSVGEQVRVCSGASEERDEALTFIQNNERAGAVIDAFTAWHAAALGALPVLTERLGKIAIPANELSQLLAMREECFGAEEGDSMSLDYRDGQYVRFIESADDRKNRMGQVNELITAVEESCSVEPVQLPDRLSELGEKLIRLPPTGAFAAAVMAGQSRLLLCEDFVMRRLARDGFGVKAVWLQTVLSSAEQAGTMSFSSYADSVVYLAHYRHGYVSVSGPVLLLVFERDNSRDLFQLEILC